MPESLDLHKYAGHVARRWRVIAASCAVAMAVAAAFTSLQTRQFTSRARVLIIPPASESFPATAISPTYMESLRTYEYLAMSDSLFQKAVEDLEIVLPGGGSVFSPPRPLLEARMMPGTRILEVRATLPDPQKAQALAAYIAAAVVRVSETAASDSAGIPATGRTETLRLVDPGIVPGSPASTGILVTVLAAFFAAFILSTAYLSFEFAAQSQKADSLRKSLRVAGHG